MQVSNGPIGDDCTQHWIAPHAMRPGSPVQVQRNALHWSVMFFAQLIEGLGPHASLISSLQAVVLSHLPLLSAIAEEETKTPTPSATAAKNVTTAFLVIVGPPNGRSDTTIDFGALPPRLRFSTRLSRGKVPLTARTKGGQGAGT